MGCRAGQFRCRAGEWVDAATCPWEAQKEGDGNLWVSSKYKLHQIHNPVLLSSPHLFSHVSAQGFKVDTLESLAWLLVHTLVLPRVMNWTNVPKTHFLYLQNADNNRTCITELFGRLEII